MIRRLLLMSSVPVLVGLVGLAVWYASTQPSRVERTLACVHGLGYAAYAYHDDGREMFDPGLTGLPPGEVQVRPPATHVIVRIPGGKYEDMTVPDNGGSARIADRGNPTKSAERAAVVACAT